MIIDSEYVEHIREGLSARAHKDEATFRAETLADLNAGYYAEVEHVGRALFGRDYFNNSKGLGQCPTCAL